MSVVESEEKRIRGKEEDGEFSIQRKDSRNEELEYEEEEEILTRWWEKLSLSEAHSMHMKWKVKGRWELRVRIFFPRQNIHNYLLTLPKFHYYNVPLKGWFFLFFFYFFDTVIIFVKIIFLHE